MAATFQTSFCAVVNIEALALACDDYAKSKGRSPLDEEQKLIDKLHRLKFVSETCFSHQVWLRASFYTSNARIAERRLKQLTAKLENLHAWYRPRV